MLYKQSKKTAIFIIACFILVVAAEVRFLGFESRMSLNCSSPYFSAAAAFSFDRGFCVDLDQIKEFVNLDDTARNNFRFTYSDNTVHYNHNPIGYAYIIIFARTLFPFLGDIVAISMLQLIVHLLICIYIFLRLGDHKKGTLLLILYGINPVILMSVLTCFYYSWQAITALTILILLFERHYIEKIGIFKRIAFISALSLLNGLILIARPTVVLAVIFFWILCLLRRYYIESLIGIVLCLVLVFGASFPTQKNIWHTACVGIAAYSNPYDFYFNDGQGYEIYENITGKDLDDSVAKGYLGNYYDDETILEYKQVTREFYLQYLRDYPLTALRNTILNVLQGYSIGYTSGMPMWAYYFNAFGGIITITMLLLTRQYTLFFAIGLICGTFTLFYPPHPSYMLGAYSMLVVGWVNFLVDFYRLRNQFDAIAAKSKKST